MPPLSRACSGNTAPVDSRERLQQETSGTPTVPPLLGQSVCIASACGPLIARPSWIHLVLLHLDWRPGSNPRRQPVRRLTGPATFSPPRSLHRCTFPRNEGSTNVPRLQTNKAKQKPCSPRTTDPVTAPPQRLPDKSALAAPQGTSPREIQGP
jgi:hypothetical protein